MEIGGRARYSEATVGRKPRMWITTEMELRRRLPGPVQAAPRCRAARVVARPLSVEQRVAMCTPGVMATSIERLKAAAGNRATDPEVGVRSAAATVEMALRNCLPVARAAVRELVQIARLKLRPLQPGHPIRTPASWIAIVPPVRRGISVRQPAALSNPVECRDPHPEVSAGVHVWAGGAAVGANYRTRTPRSRR